MSKKTFKKWDIKNAVYNDTDENSPLILVEREDGQECILQDRSTELYYRYVLNETGSHYTEAEYSFEWEDDEIELVEVVKVSKVIKVWVPVELGEVNIT